MATQSDIQRMLADLNANLDKGRSTPFLTQRPDFGNSANVASGNYVPSGKGGGDDTPLWMKALTGLSATGKLVTDNLANFVTGNWSDNNLTQGWKGQKEAWSDGKLGFGDIPGLGALYGIGKYGKGFDKTLEHFGADKGGKVSRWGGLIGDITLDPLNLTTFGGASAIKAGKAAMALAGKEGAQLGLTGEKLSQFVSDAGRAKRATAQNAAWNFDVPFTNITKQFGQKADLFKIFDPKIGAQGAAAANDAFRTVGLNPDDAGQMSE